MMKKSSVKTKTILIHCLDCHKYSVMLGTFVDLLEQLGSGSMGISHVTEDLFILQRDWPLDEPNYKQK